MSPCDDALQRRTADDRCPVPINATRRCRRWCSPLLPEVAVEFSRWIGAEIRQPLHAVVVLHPNNPWPSLAVYDTVDDLRRERFVQVTHNAHSRNT